MTAPLNTASLVSEIRAQIGSEFDGELHLSEDQAHALLDALESTCRALSEKEGECERLAGLLHANGTPRFNEAMRRLEAAEQALRPFGDAANGLAPDLPATDQVLLTVGGLPIAWVFTDQLRRARSVLENGPQTLADATKKDPGTEQREAGRNPAYDGPMGIFEGYGEEP